MPSRPAYDPDCDKTSKPGDVARHENSEARCIIMEVGCAPESLPLRHKPVTAQRSPKRRSLRKPDEPPAPSRRSPHEDRRPGQDEHVDRSDDQSIQGHKIAFVTSVNFPYISICGLLV
jgi:hypothetical protein